MGEYREYGYSPYGVYKRPYDEDMDRGYDYEIEETKTRSERVAEEKIATLKEQKRHLIEENLGLNRRNKQLKKQIAHLLEQKQIIKENSVESRTIKLIKRIKTRPKTEKCSCHIHK